MHIVDGRQPGHRRGGNSIQLLLRRPCFARVRVVALAVKFALPGELYMVFSQTHRPSNHASLPPPSRTLWPAIPDCPRRPRMIDTSEPQPIAISFATAALTRVRSTDLVSHKRLPRKACVNPGVLWRPIDERPHPEQAVHFLEQRNGRYPW